MNLVFYELQSWEWEPRIHENQGLLLYSSWDEGMTLIVWQISYLSGKKSYVFITKSSTWRSLPVFKSFEKEKVMLVQFLIVVPAILGKDFVRRGFLQLIFGWQWWSDHCNQTGLYYLESDKRHFDTIDSDIFATPSGPAYQSGQNEDLVSDMQYILQTLTGIEDRLAKVEDSISRQGDDI